MARRQSLSNGYNIPLERKLIPSSYQHEPIPMLSQTKTPIVPNKTNRIVPSSPDYNTYSYQKTPFGTSSSMMSAKPLIQTSQIYPYKQSDMNKNNLNQSYYQPNNHLDDYPDNNPEQNEKPTSCFSKPLCLGLTRLSGGILFGTMILLAAASLAGLITTVILYVKDTSTDPQWKILGMVVCGIMLLTVFVTLCIFIYCYKHGRIVNNNNNQNNLLTSTYNQRNNMQIPYNPNQSYDTSSIPYGIMPNNSIMSPNDDTIQVQDKQTNTETTICPLRPRDYQRGVWQVMNAYGGISYRSLEQPKMISRLIQVQPNEIDQAILQRNNQIANMGTRGTNRLGYGDEQRSRHFMEPQSHYNVVEDIIERPPLKGQLDDYDKLSKKDKLPKQKYNKVSVQRVKPKEQLDVDQENFNTDHFYQ